MNVLLCPAKRRDFILEVYILGKTTTDMQLVPIGKLVPYANNARTHSPEQITKLRSSLREFGFVNPVIIDRDYGIMADVDLDATQEGGSVVFENYRVGTIEELLHGE